MWVTNYSGQCLKLTPLNCKTIFVFHQTLTKGHCYICILATMALQWSLNLTCAEKFEVNPTQVSYISHMCVILACKVSPYSRVSYFKQICWGEPHLRGTTGSRYWKTCGQCVHIDLIKLSQRECLKRTEDGNEDSGEDWEREPRRSVKIGIKMRVERGGGQRREKSGVCVHFNTDTDSALTASYVSEPTSTTVQRNQSEALDQKTSGRYHLDNNNHTSMVKITFLCSSKVHALTKAFIPQTILRQRQTIYTCVTCCSK